MWRLLKPYKNFREKKPKEKKSVFSTLFLFQKFVKFSCCCSNHQCFNSYMNVQQHPMFLPLQNEWKQSYSCMHQFPNHHLPPTSFCVSIFNFLLFLLICLITLRISYHYHIQNMSSPSTLIFILGKSKTKVYSNTFIQLQCLI